MPKLTNGLQLVGGIDAVNPVHVDTKYGPYSSLADANASVLGNDRTFVNGAVIMPRTVGIVISGVQAEYWWFGGIADNNLVVKSTGGSVSFMKTRCVTLVNDATEQANAGGVANNVYITTQAAGTAAIALLAANPTWPMVYVLGYVTDAATVGGFTYVGTSSFGNKITWLGLGAGITNIGDINITLNGGQTYTHNVASITCGDMYATVGNSPGANNVFLHWACNAYRAATGNYIPTAGNAGNFSLTGNNSDIGIAGGPSAIGMNAEVSSTTLFNVTISGPGMRCGGVYCNGAGYTIKTSAETGKLKVFGSLDCGDSAITPCNLNINDTIATGSFFFSQSSVFGIKSITINNSQSIGFTFNVNSGSTETITLTNYNVINSGTSLLAITGSTAVVRITNCNFNSPLFATSVINGKFYNSIFNTTALGNVVSIGTGSEFYNCIFKSSNTGSFAVPNASTVKMVNCSFQGMTKPITDPTVITGNQIIWRRFPLTAGASLKSSCEIQWNNTTLGTFPLPTVNCVAGDVIALIGINTGKWKITQAATQQINYAGVTPSTAGTGGSVSAANANDRVELLCTVDNKFFTIISITAAPVIV